MDRKIDDLIEGLTLTAVACIVILCDKEVRAKVASRVRMWRIYRNEGTVPQDWVRDIYDGTR